MQLPLEREQRPTCAHEPAWRAFNDVILIRIIRLMFALHLQWESNKLQFYNECFF